MPPSSPPHGRRDTPGLTLTEEELRFLQADVEGVPHARAVTFLGAEYPVTGAGLVAMLRYAVGSRSGHKDSQQFAMAAAHRVLEECLDPEYWADFQEAAIAGKARAEQVFDVVQQVVEVHTARPWRAGLRLLGYAAVNMAELDGTLLATTGRGMADLTPRQLCNLVLAQLLKGRDDEQRAEFLEDLYLDYDPEAEARMKVYQMIADQEEAVNGHHSG
jgi:hypothetical protein